MTENLKLRTRMLLYFCSLVCIAFTLTIGFVTINARNLVKTQALREAHEIASRYGNDIKVDIEVALDAARTLAQTFEGIKAHSEIPQRAMTDAILKQILEKNTRFIAVWTVWEPDAIDGKDKSYVNQWGHDDTGRYIPYWNRATGFSEVEPMSNYNIPEKNDFYRIPRITGREMIVDPQKYPISGADVLMTRVEVPVSHDDKIVGVVGVDIMLTTFELLVAKIRPFEKGSVAIISHNGRYAANPDSGQVTQDIGTDREWITAKEAIRDGKPFQFADAEFVRIFVPIVIGKTETPWSFLVNIPMDDVLKSSAKITSASIIISMISILLLIIVIFMITASVTRPLNEIVRIADTIALGDLSHEITIVQKDEIGNLADSFRNMKGRINDMLNEISALIHAIRIGRLDVRGNAEKFTGSWSQLVSGLNHLIDAFVFPITKTSAALDHLSKGEIPEPITDTYQGDFNKIKDNLNMLIDVTKETIRAAEEISNGNLSAEVTERSENDRMIKALNRMIRRLKEILLETGAMISSVRRGVLNIRGNAEAFEGGWHELVSGMNDLIEGLRRAVSDAAAMSIEMELARRIQTSLLPSIMNNLHPDFEIAATMLPTDRVGGDFYDITYDRKGNLWIAIGDVSGHGVTPGLIMMMAQTVHATVTNNIDCEARNVVIMINEILYKNVRERLKESHFMTFTALKYLGRGRFQHAGAHLSMIVFRQKTGECELIRTNGIYLNFKKDISKATKNSELFLDHGDILVLYTDGLTESHNPDGKMLDIGGFVNIVKSHAHRDPEAMKDMIMADVINWCDDKRADDMTIVVIKRNE